MTATIIDGNPIAQKMRARISQDAASFKETHGYAPGLGVVLVGDNPASATYVRMKERACADVGITSATKHLPEDTTQAEVVAAVTEFNADPNVHGILVQLPLPRHIDEEAVLRAVSLEKDVDGLHPVNIGLLALKGREPLFTPATPTGCMVILEEAGVDLNGANAVVVGRSNIVGMPMALLLIKANATVTVCHSRTRDMPEFLSRADVVIAAAGMPGGLRGEWFKPGAVVVDVGTSPVDDPDSPRGYRLVGDVDLESARDVVGAITKVPGGVGPMTITMLLHNTMKAAWHSVGGMLE